MARFSFWGRAVDQFGNIKPNTGITIYLADTTDAATVYTQQTGGTGISTAPQVTTDSHGRFNFWVDDVDYDRYDQLFDIVVAGLKYTKVDIFRAEIITVSGATTEFVESVSAASKEADNRVREYAASLESPSANIINRAYEYTDVLRVDVEDVDGQLASHLASADVHFTQSEIDFANIGVSAHAHPRYDTIDVSSVSAASHEQDNRVREYADVEIVSVSAASDEKDNRILEQILAVSAASLEQDNRLLQLITVSGGQGIFSQAEKFALEMEMEFRAAQAGYYKELTYIDFGSLQGSLFDIDIYTDSTKISHLFHKDLYYNLTNQLSRTHLTRIEDDAQVVKFFTYDVDGKLESIEISAYTPYEYSQYPGGGGTGVTDHGDLTGLLDDDHPQYASAATLQKHLASASVHFTQSQIDFSSVSGASREQDSRLREYIDNIDLQTLVSLLSVSAASDEKDQRLQDQIDGLGFTGTPSGSIYNRSIEYTDYNIHNLTLPTSASQLDILSLSAASQEEDNRLWERIELIDPEAESVSAASKEADNRVREELNNNITYEIHNITLPTSASQEDLNNIRYDLNTFTSPNSASQDDLTYAIHNLTLPTSASDNDVTYAIHNITLPTSASQSDLDNIRYDLNTFTSPNSASQDDLTYAIHNLTLPTSASDNDITYAIHNLTLPASAGQEDILSVSAASREQDNRLTENIEDVDNQLMSHLLSGGIHLDKRKAEDIFAQWNFSQGTSADFIDFNLNYTGTHQEGRLHWNPDDGTLELGLPGGNVILQIGQEQVLVAVNKSGVFIPNGTPVYVDGAQGTRPTIAPAQANSVLLDYDTAFVIGVTTEDIPNNSSGYITMAGLVRDVDTSSYPAGSRLWLSDAVSGSFMTSAPTAPNHKISVGYSIFQNSESGIIFVKPVLYSAVMLSSDVFNEIPCGGQILKWIASASRFELSNDLHELTYKINTFSSPNSASQDDIRYEINQLTLPTSASQDDLRYEINNLTLPLSASYEDVLTVSAASKEQDQRIYETLHLPDRIVDGDNIVRARDTDNVILVSAGGMPVVSAGVGLKLFGDPNIDGTLWQRFGNLEVTRSGIKTSNNLVDGSGYGRIEHFSGTWQFTHDQNNGNVSFYTHLSNGTKQTALAFFPNGTGPSYTALYAGNNNVLNTFNNGADYGIWITAGGSAGALFTTRPGTDQLIIKNLEHGALSTCGIYIRQADGAKIILLDESDSIIVSGAQTEIYGTPVKLKNDNVQTLSTTAGGIVVGDGDRQASFLLSTGRDLIIKNNTAVGDVYLQVTDNTGSVDTVFRGAYNSSAYLYFDNSVKFLTQTAGVRITSDGGTTNSDIVFSGNDVYYRNEVNSGIFYIQAKDSAGTRHTLFSGNSGVASLYHQGTQSLSTTGSGIIVHSQGDILQKTYLVTDNSGDFIVHPNSITGSFIVSAHSGKQFETFGSGVKIYNAITGNALNLSMSSTNAQIQNESGASFEFKNSSNATIFYFLAADYRFYGSSTVNWVNLAQWPTVQDFRLKSVNPKGVFKIQSSDGPYVSLNDSTKTITLSANIIKLGGGHQELTVYKQIDGVQQGGIELYKGARIREISNDLTLDQSPSSAITERVFRTHILQASAGIRTQELIHTVGGEPTGFENQTDSVITFSDATSALNISGYAGGIYDYWIAGVNYPVDGSTPKSTAVIGQGINYFYLDTSGNLLVTQSFSSDVLLKDNTYVANVYWDNGNDKHIMLGDERHSIMWDWNIHGYHHLTEGTKYEDGLGLGDITAGGSGDLNTSAIVSCTQGHIRDEDIRLTITAVPVSGGASQDFTGGFPVFYREGANGDWKRQDPSPFPVINFVGGGGRLAWNEFTLGVWQQTEVGSGNIVLAHLFASNDQNIGNQVIAIQGQNEYTNIGDAEVGATTELLSLSQGDLPFVEFQPIGTLIYQTNNTYNNAVKGRIILTGDGSDYVDFRGFRGFTAGGTSVSEHGNLSGLDDDDHLQYANLDGSRNFTGTIGGLAGVSDTDFIIKSQLDSNILSVSAASKEQDNRLQEDIDSHTHPAGETATDRVIDGDNIVRARDTDNVIMVSAGGQTIAHYFTDGVRFKSGGTQSLQVTAGGIVVGTGDQQTQLLYSPETGLTLTDTLSAASQEGDNRLQEYVDGLQYELNNLTLPTSASQTYAQNQATYVIHNLTLPTSASQEDILSVSGSSREQDNRLYEYVDAQTGSLQSDRIVDGINIVRVREDSNTIQASANGTEVLNLSEHRQQIGPSGTATDSNFTIRTTHADLRLRDTQMIWAEWSGRQVDIGDPAFLNTQLGTNQFNILDGADSNRQYLVINTATKYAQLGGTGSDDVRVVVRNDPDGWVEGAWQATRLFRFKEEINNSNLPAFQLGSSQWIDTISNDDTLTAGPSAISTTESIKRYIDRSLAVSGGVILRGTESLASGITSAAVSYTEQIDENFTISTELINSIDNPPSIYSHIIIKKGLDEFRILFSGSLDSDNYRLDWAIIR